MLLAILLAAQAAPDCRFDRAAMLAMPQTAFDQDMAGGWRVLADRGCTLAAADLIRDWREAHAPPPKQATILFWHEGQLRANAGQTTAAMALLERSHKPIAEDAGLGWNPYVDATIAFLRGDRAAFEAAYARLAALPKPDDFDPRTPDGKPMAISWPINLDVLNGLRNCWGQRYRQAYALPCRVSTSR